MKLADKTRSFSLIEVIIAVGIFAGTVTVVIGLMTALSRQAAESLDSLTAQGLPGAIKVELDRLATAGFDHLAGQVPLLAAPLPDGFPLVAARDAAEAESLFYLPRAGGRIPSEAQYYLIECWRFGTEPLRYDAPKAFLALHVRVSWPYRVSGVPAPAPLPDRNQLTFAVILNR